MADTPEADDRTEEPTQRKLDEAIDKGDVAKSQEVNTFFVLGAFALVLLFAAGPAGRGLGLDLRAFLMNAHLVPSDGAGMIAAARYGLLAALAALAAPLILLALAGLAGPALQNRPVWTGQPLKPQLSRISPKSGAKRIFGREALAQFLKGLVKIATVGAVAGIILWSERGRLDGFARLDPAALLPGVLWLVLKLLAGVLAVHAVVAIADVIYQRLTWLKRQRMTRRELKEEFKNTEGSPEIKAKLRQIRQSRVKKRMMAAVPSATVVVTNPTHYAVALKYETGMAAPVCVAKGLDALALRIRAVAAENDVPVIENPPLARALHASVEVDAEIPVEHYKAVAEVIGYVLRLRRRPA
ncbi:MAG TPA: flagellar biosynthesis protein FlhB [Beijerinckiaceae bacterium]|nr:flagellar biosynthesis protein FlhB [Beijerinckiaceae bacterium]